jgi:hypothetical protein
MIWNSYVGFLCAIAKHVTVREQRFEEMLDMLDPVLGRDDVREALECCNADAVWLRLYKKSRQSGGGERSGSGLAHRAHGFAGRLPVGKAHWQFVRV